MSHPFQGDTFMSSHRSVGLRREYEELKLRYREALIEARTWKQAYRELLERVETRLDSPPVPPSQSGDSHLPVSTTLNHDDYPQLRFWFSHQWNTFKNENKEEQLAPATWGAAPPSVQDRYCTEMEEAFPELRFCAFHWKAKEIAKLIYPSWYANHLGKRAPTARRRVLLSKTAFKRPTNSRSSDSDSDEPRSTINKRVRTQSRAPSPSASALLLPPPRAITPDFEHPPSTANSGPSASPLPAHPTATLDHDSNYTAPSPSLSLSNNPPPRPVSPNSGLVLPLPPSMPSDSEETQATTDLNEFPRLSTPHSAPAHVAPPVRECIQSALPDSFSSDEDSEHNGDGDGEPVDVTVQLTRPENVTASNSSGTATVEGVVSEPRLTTPSTLLQVQAATPLGQGQAEATNPPHSESGEGLSRTVELSSSGAGTSIVPASQSCDGGTPTASGSASESAVPRGRGGDKIMIPSDKLTARNLYAQEWVREHPGGLVDEFRASFNALSKEDRKKYERQSRELAKTKKSEARGVLPL
ncbi:hypothetical protein GSI_04940 [Ganoderma sinense ZZ0214-1]|uniref:Uncharacterized protein n=1 Tax=Ganoderma sinense ZZ0214-1 TaxID=1077348 RepID=A0A2G8SGD8_9APHY|nr:hypothetical protein GSI_04940 [Ganoderma sinense ZZ0214-1]